MTPRCFALLPRDGMFLKDGRGWDTSDSGRSHTLPWPLPSTLLGALRAVWGRYLEQSAPGGLRLDMKAWPVVTAVVTLGPTLALRRAWGEPWAPSQRMWPAPADYLAVEEEKERLVRLDPEPPGPPTLGRDDDPVREALWRPPLRSWKPERSPSWWTEDELRAWLRGDRPRKQDEAGRRARELARRVDVRLAIEPTTWTAREGALFAAETVEMLGRREGLPWEWAILVEASFPSDAAIESIPAALGGARRIARLEPLDPSLLGIPSASPDEPPYWRESPGLRLLFVTPAVFEKGWLPNGFEARDGAFRGRLPGVDGEVILRAAFVPRSIAVSSWNIAENLPRPGVRAVAPGAVYFFHKEDERASFTPQEMKSVWLASLGERAHEGFGRVVAGPWMCGMRGASGRTEESI